MPNGPNYAKLDVSVNKLFFEEATVIVWRNVKKLGLIPTGHFGHAAIMLRGPSLGLAADEYSYISWWPGDGAGKEDALRGQSGIAETNYQSDMGDEMSSRAQERLGRGEITPRRNQLRSLEGWGAASDAQVSVPGIGLPQDPEHPFGLCLARMRDWFADYQGNGGGYQLASTTKSCAGVAMVALVEGGSKGFADPPRMLIMAEPKQVEDYGRTVQRAIIAFNRRAKVFERQAKAEMLLQQRQMFGVTGFAPRRSLWSVTDWKRQSAVKGAMRSSLIRSIDSHLEKYHKKTWAGDFADKYKHLVKMMNKIMEHREKKPDSKRAFAVSRLGLQALEVTRLLRTDQNP